MYRSSLLLLLVLLGLTTGLLNNPRTFVGSHPPLPGGFPGVSRFWLLVIIAISGKKDYEIKDVSQFLRI